MEAITMEKKSGAIFVIDNDPEILKLFSLIMRMYGKGHPVETYSSCEDALESETTAVTLIFVDGSFYGSKKKGPEYVPILLEKWPDAVVVGHTTIPEVIGSDFLRAGATHVVRKPSIIGVYEELLQRYI